MRLGSPFLNSFTSSSLCPCPCPEGWGRSEDSNRRNRVVGGKACTRLFPRNLSHSFLTCHMPPIHKAVVNTSQPIGYLPHSGEQRLHLVLLFFIEGSSQSLTLSPDLSNILNVRRSQPKKVQRFQIKGYIPALLLVTSHSAQGRPYFYVTQASRWVEVPERKGWLGQ